jgi:broad specificity phosphatase PhoE
MQLIFVRHGETDFNKHKRVMGQRVDAPLDDAGVQQAHAILPKIPKDFALIYSSPLKRAIQTARIIADFHNKDIKIDNNLLERDFGSMSGKTWEEMEVETHLPMTELDNNLEYDYTPYGGEKAAQVRQRLMNFLEGVKAKHAQEKVVVVTHYGIIRLMESLYPQTEHHKTSNASVHKFDIH